MIIQWEHIRILFLAHFLFLITEIFNSRSKPKLCKWYHHIPETFARHGLWGWSRGTRLKYTSAFKVGNARCNQMICGCQATSRTFMWTFNTFPLNWKVKKKKKKVRRRTDIPFKDFLSLWPSIQKRYKHKQYPKGAGCISQRWEEEHKYVGQYFGMSNNE